MTQHIHQAIAEGLAEELAEPLGIEWTAHTSRRGEDWSVIVLPRLCRAWPQVGIDLKPDHVAWRGYWSTPEAIVVELPDGEKIAIITQSGKAAETTKIAYDDPWLVPELIRHTVDWMTKYQDCTVMELPPGTRPPTRREWLKEWWINSTGAAFFDAPDEIPPIMMYRDGMSPRRHRPAAAET